MKDYVIVTDSSCDLPKKLVKEWGIEVLSLEVSIDGVGSFLNHEIEPEKFYEYLRDKRPVKTSGTCWKVETNIKTANTPIAQ